MVSLIATQPLRYARRDLRAEDSFDAAPQDAHVLVTIGKARYGTRAESPAVRPTVPETALSDEEAEAVPRRRRRRRLTDSESQD